MNGMTQKYACEILSKYASQKDDYVKEILAEREHLIPELEKIPSVRKIYPSDANILLVKIDNAHEVYKFLVRQGIIVRDRTKVFLCEDCLRITVGTAKENKMLIEKLKEF